MLNGGEPILSKFTSDTYQTRLYSIKGTPYYAIDSPGFLDNRDENDRSTLFNSMLQTIHQEQIKVKKIFILMSGTDRFNEKLLDWLADLMAATRAPLDQVVIILTKLDTPFIIKLATPVIQKAQQVFQGSTIITCGCNEQGITNTQVMSEFSNLESLPDINVQSNFQTSQKLRFMLSELEEEKKTTEVNHQLWVAQETLSKERQINYAREQVRIWMDRYDQAIRSHCPIFGDKTSTMREARAAIEQLNSSIDALRNGQISVAQSQADVAHFCQHMRAIQDDLESRSGFLTLFKRLITS